MASLSSSAPDSELLSSSRFLFFFLLLCFLCFLCFFCVLLKSSLLFLSEVTLSSPPAPSGALRGMEGGDIIHNRTEEGSDFYTNTSQAVTTKQHP